MAEQTVVVFGAGATKACGGPLTNEILRDALREAAELERQGHLALVERFLVENFHLPRDRRRRRTEHFPQLPLLLSLVDTAIDRGHSFGPGWDVERLRAVRAGLEFAVFALLEHRLRRLGRNVYLPFLQRLLPDDPDAPPALTVISLNYDLIADNSVSAAAERTGRGAAFPDYCCDVATESYRTTPKLLPLLKLHGSLNWLFCPNCQRLDIGVSKRGRIMAKVFIELYGRGRELDEDYEAGRAPCAGCGEGVRPVLVTPTHLKDYRNPHISRVWYDADRRLRECDRAIFVGYSLPEDDVDVTYLFKRGLSHLDPARITVVEHGGPTRPDQHPVGRRYRSLFGDGIDWHTGGFAAYARA